MLASRCRIIVFRLLVLFVGTFRSKALQVLPLKKKKREEREGKEGQNSLEKKCADTFQLLCVAHAPLSSSASPLGVPPPRCAAAAPSAVAEVAAGSRGSR